MRKEGLRFESDESINSLTSQLISCTNDSGLCNTLMKNKSRLDLSGRQTVTGDVDDIWDNCQ